MRRSSGPAVDAEMTSAGAVSACHLCRVFLILFFYSRFVPHKKEELPCLLEDKLELKTYLTNARVTHRHGTISTQIDLSRGPSFAVIWLRATHAGNSLQGRPTGSLMPSNEDIRRRRRRSWERREPMQSGSALCVDTGELEQVTDTEVRGEDRNHRPGV